MVGHLQDCPRTKAEGARVLSHPGVVPRNSDPSALLVYPTGRGADPQPEGGRCWRPEAIPRAAPQVRPAYYLPGTAATFTWKPPNTPQVFSTSPCHGQGPKHRR